MRFIAIGITIILLSGCASTEPKIQKSNDSYPYVEIKSPVEYRSEQYPLPDTYAKYPGGKDGLMNYIRMNTRYPINALQDGIYGDVVVTYVIGTDGLVKDIEAVESPSEDFTKMFVRIIENMDRWKPAMLNGEAVEQKYAIKTRFNEARIFKGN